MYLYKITNIISGSIYIGVTKTTIKQRFSSHKCASKRGNPGKLYDAMRSYGIDKFEIEMLYQYKTEEAMLLAELQLITYIKLAGIKNYNLKAGGSKIFGVNDKPAWQQKLKEKRKDRKPALGMKHSDENKKLFSSYGTHRWDLYGRYPKEVLDYGFTESNKRYGISKTHYYRLRKERILSND